MIIINAWILHITDKRKVHSAPTSARYGRADKQTIFANNGGGDETSLPSNTSLSGSGYNSDPTFNGRHKAQPAHINMTLSQKNIVYMPDNTFKPPIMHFAQRPMFVPMSMLPRSHFAPVGMNGGPRHMLQASMVNSNSMPAVSQSQPGHGGMPVSLNSLPSGSNLSGLNSGVPTSTVSVQCGKVYQSSNQSSLYQGGGGQSQGLVSVSEKPAALLNGNDNNCLSPSSQISMEREYTSVGTSALTKPPVMSMSTTTSTTASVSYSCASPTMASSRALCTACGGTGQNGQQQQQAPSVQNVQYLQHNIFTHQQMMANNIMPVPMQHFFPVHQYMNGLSQDMMYGHPHMFLPTPSAHQGMNTAVPGMHAGFTYYNHAPQAGPYGLKRPRKLNCHNCGSSKHSANDCTEGSMEAMSGMLVVYIYAYSCKNIATF